MTKVYDTLKSMNLEQDRLMDLEVAITDIATLPQKINDYAARVKEMGMSPFKDL